MIISSTIIVKQYNKGVEEIKNDSQSAKNEETDKRSKLKVGTINSFKHRLQ